MVSNDVIELSCPAKVNLALSVGSVREGMHPIASWMVAVSFADRLMVRRAAKSRFDIAFDDEVNERVDWPLEKDLAWRAHQLLQQQAGRALPIEVILQKRIATGAGLGGGSSDAAGVLVAVDRLYELKLGEAKLTEFGLRLGSDVGFAVGAMLGKTSALVTGFGERIEPAAAGSVIHLVLVFTPVKCATGAVYAAFDRQVGGGVVEADQQRVRALMAEARLSQGAPFNDLAAPACAVQPRLGALREQLQKQLDLPVHITGSGAAMFIVAPSAITAKPLARKVTAISGLRAVATRVL